MKLTGELRSKTLTSQYQFQSIQRAHNNEYARTHHTRSSYRLKIIVFASIHHIHVDGRKRCENATCGHEFFEKRGKKVAFSSEYGYVRTMPHSQ